VLVLAVAAPAAAQVTDGCSYDPSTLTVSVFAAEQTFANPWNRDKAPENQLIVGSVGAIEFDGVACGPATVTNTDTIIVTGEPYTDLFIDLAGGMFAPGISPEADGSPEIEIYVTFETEEVSEDLLIIWGTEARDSLVAGRLGIDVTGDLDADVFPNSGLLYLVGFAGRDSLSARGGHALGGSARGSVLFGRKGDDRLKGGAYFDFLSGGDGNDRLAAGGDDDLAVGEGGHDLVKGQEGRDRLAGGRGNDRVLGGPARDVCKRGPGNDTVRCELRFRDVFSD
jgi:hypothetical protein